MDKKEYSLTPNLIYREEDNDAVLCNSDTFDLVMLNETGNFIWKLIERGFDREGIVVEMLNRYNGVDRPTVEKDVDKILTQLSVAKIIT